MPGHFVRQLSCHNSVIGTGFRITGVILWGLLGLGCLFGPVAPAGAALPAGKLLVAATIVPLGDFCQQIGGDLVQVQVLIPPGASPHAFEPAPSVMARASQARVFVYVGAGLEPWAARLLRSRGSNNLVVVEAARGMPLIREAQEHHHSEAASEEGRQGHRHLAGNPHIWLDQVAADLLAKVAQRHNGGGYQEFTGGGRGPGRGHRPEKAPQTQETPQHNAGDSETVPNMRIMATQLPYEISRHLWQSPSTLISI